MRLNDELANFVEDFKERIESSITIEKLRELEEKRNRINLLLLMDKDAKLTPQYWDWNEKSVQYLRALQNHIYKQERYDDMIRSYISLAEVIDNK